MPTPIIVTKYALTTGVFRILADRDRHEIYAFERSKNGKPRRVFHCTEFATTEELAVSQIELRRARRIRELEKALERARNKVVRIPREGEYK
jgi:hypothetical protein